MVFVVFPSGRPWGLASYPPFHICSDGFAALINRANTGSMLPASTVSYMMLPSHRGSSLQGLCLACSCEIMVTARPQLSAWRQGDIDTST